MEENMGDREGTSPLRDSGLLQFVGDSLSHHSSEVTCLMTDIVIERVLNAPKHPCSTMTQMDVELVRDDIPEREKMLFEKISSGRWKYNQVIELKNGVIVKAILDDMGRVGSVTLGKTEVEKFKSDLGPKTYEFLIGQEARPMFRLKFQIVSIPLHGESSQQAFNCTVKRDNNGLFSIVRYLPADWTVKRPVFLDACGAHFLASFKNSRALCCSAGGRALQARFSRTGNLTDISKAILFQRKSVRLTPEGNLCMAVRLFDLGKSLQLRFWRTGELQDISEAILFGQKAVQLIPEGDVNMAYCLSTLGNSLQSRFLHTGELQDISEAILFGQKAVQLTPKGDADMGSRLSILGFSFQSRFWRTGELQDISEAILFGQKAVQHTPEGDANMASRLSILGSSFQSRFSRTGELQDISEAILFGQKAVQHTPEGHANMASHLSILGSSLQSRFLHTGELQDISEAILLGQKAVQLTPEGHVIMAACLSALGISLQSRFLHTGELQDISEAILLGQKAVQLTPEGDANMAYRLSRLSHSHHERVLRLGELTDISEAISLQQNAVQLTPEGHVDMAHYLSFLGHLLQERFLHTGELLDSSQAILLGRNAVQLTPEGDVNMATRLASLGRSLQDRFWHTGELTDLSEAISLQRNAVQLIPEGHTDMAFHLSTLGRLLRSHFSRTGGLSDLSEAISFGQKSVQLTPEFDVEMASHLYDLGLSLKQRFLHTGELTDISEAISLQQKAIQLTPEGDFKMLTFLFSLAHPLRLRYSVTGELPDISEAILSGQKAVQLLPEGHAAMPSYRYDLGHSLQQRFSRTGQFTDIQATISEFSLAANSSSGSPSNRLIAAKDWAALSQKYDPSQLLDAYRTAIPLISRVAGFEKTIEKRHNDLTEISTLSTSAAAVAFASERLDLALEWLEQGRCLVWSQLNDLRTPLESLRSHDPRIADELMSVSQALENAGSRGQPFISVSEDNMLQKIVLQDEVVAHVTFAQRWDQLLEMVRNIPDFEDFLKPPSNSALLKKLPSFGIVIVVNVHQDRCDALALRSGIEPLHIPLPELSYIKADGLRNALKDHLKAAGVRMRESKPDGRRGMRYGDLEHDTSLKLILSTLWTSVVKPILNSLGYYEPPHDLTRIWWCATGPLAFLPIHAAGIYDEINPENTLALSDFAISSYTPTVRALVNIVKSPREFEKEKVGLFMISQPDTPGLIPIPGTAREACAVEQQLKSRKLRVLRLESAAATVDRGITNMKDYSSIHLACHAVQDTTTPLKSGFALYDGRLELSSIIRQSLVGADFAFLSACQTSAGDERLSEEAVHLAAGMLAAGYRGAVASMWSIRDEYGQRVAEDFYENLTQDSVGLSGEYAARALHYATNNLRKSLGYSESAFLAWVPYVHFGL